MTVQDEKIDRCAEKFWDVIRLLGLKQESRERPDDTDRIEELLYEAARLLAEIYKGRIKNRGDHHDRAAD